jgi:diguanylate cyclase (GGDEF)-like protein
MVVLIVLVVSVGHYNVSKISRESTDNFSNRLQLQELGRKIRFYIFEAHKDLDAFLLDPTRSEHKQQIHQALDAAIAYSDDLKSHPWIQRRNGEQALYGLSEQLIGLKAHIDELIQTRIDPTRQYPSLALGNRTMRPSRRNITNAFSIIFNELSEEANANPRQSVYVEVVEARHLWEQMLSNFRLYLANRVGSFNEEVLPVQESAVDTMYQQLQDRLQTLAQLDEQGKLGFQSSAALVDLHNNLNAWYEGFTGVKVIHQSDNWRADTKFIKEKIEPLLENISASLVLLDKDIDKSAKEDLNTLTNVANLQTNILYLIAAFGLVFIALSAFSLQRLIFRPIETVARALKAEAFGKDGEVLPSVRSRETQNLIDAFAEMRKQVRLRQSELQHQALHDSLTNLPNRTLLHDRVDHAIHIARREHKAFVLLMMDLDHFKEVNDTLGHHVGDRLLIEVGKVLKKSLREIDTVARLGGDEFAILLPDTNAEQAVPLAKKITDALEKGFHIDELNLFVKSSTGIAEYPTHGKDVATLLQRADVAMYVAKRNKYGVAVYDPKDDEYSIGRLSLMSDLRDAIDHDKLTLHYQPMFNMHTGTVVGTEALLRWEHPDYGAIPPDQIVTLAEQTGLIDNLSKWVLKSAIAQCSRWRDHGFELNVAVNLSVFNLKDPELITRIADLLRRENFPKESLILEITESAMMANPAQAVETLSKLDAMGVKLAIDDFGTGFSSLAYLKQLPVDELKIDKSFIIDMHKDENDEVIVRSTIELAHNLGLNVVAEGVENAATYRLLQQFGCDAAQGYFLSPPLKVAHLEKWLAQDADVLCQEIKKIQNF